MTFNVSENVTNFTSAQEGALIIVRLLHVFLGIAGFATNLTVFSLSVIRKRSLLFEALLFADTLLSLAYGIRGALWLSGLMETTVEDCLKGDYAVTVTINMALYSTCAVTVGRFVCVFAPMFHEFHRERITHALVAASYMLSIATVVASAASLQSIDKEVFECTTASFFDYTFAKVLAYLRVPVFATICILYFALAVKLVRLRVGFEDEAFVCGRYRETGKLVMWIVGVYIVCWMVPLVDLGLRDVSNPFARQMCHDVFPLTTPLTSLFNGIFYASKNPDLFRSKKTRNKRLSSTSSTRTVVTTT